MTYRQVKVTMHTHQKRHQHHRRSGLAPLELVLSLPILLFVMALMIIFGTAGAWKVRTHVNAREVAWREFWPRNGSSNGNPSNWPPGAPMEDQAAGPPVFSRDPYLDHVVVRGPMLVDPQTGAFMPVRQGTLSLQGGLRAGFARIRRDYPIFRRLPPHEIDFPRHHQVLDGSRWQFGTMGMWSNLARRVLFLYDVDLLVRIGAPVQLYVDAAVAMLYDPTRPDLVPLRGGDPEVAALGRGRSPDFVPPIPLGTERASISALRGRSLRPTVCEGDPSIVRQDQVHSLLERIENVPERMARYYKSLYESLIQQARDGELPPGVPDLSGEWQTYVNQLNVFLQQLAQN